MPRTLLLFQNINPFFNVLLSPTLPLHTVPSHLHVGELSISALFTLSVLFSYFVHIKILCKTIEKIRKIGLLIPVKNMFGF